jgi:hypothetical protein
MHGDSRARNRKETLCEVINKLRGGHLGVKSTMGVLTPRSDPHHMQGHRGQPDKMHGAKSWENRTTLIVERKGGLISLQKTVDTD